MAIIDIAIVIIFAVSAFFGYRRGFISQIGALAAIVVGIVACRMLGPQVVDLMMPASADHPEAYPLPRYSVSILAYAAVYLIAYYAVILVARLLRTVTHALLLGPLDRIGGAMVNVVKWFMAVSLVLNLYLAIWPDGKLLSTSHLAGGRSVTWIIDLAPTVLGAMLPNE